MFDSENEINQKLGNCIVLKDNRPLYVIGANSSRAILGVFKDGTKEEARVNLNDPGLDFKNLGERLGYINLRSVGRRLVRETYYMMRQPIRRSIQGLHDNNIYISSPRNPESAIGSIQFHHVYQENGDELSCTFRGQYSSLRDIERDFSKDSSLFSRAFSRDWAVERNKEIGPEFNLMYKMQKIGYSEDLHNLRISPKFKMIERDLDKIKEAALA